MRGNKAVAEHKVMAGRAPQAGRVPGVEDRGVAHRQEHEPQFRPPAGVSRGWSPSTMRQPPSSHVA